MLNYTINKANSSINLTLDGTATNKTIEADSTAVTIRAETITPTGGYLELYEDGNLINNGTDPLVNTTTYNAIGTYNITAIYPTTQNYLTSSETLFITVEDTTNPSVTNITTDPGAINQTQTTNISAIVTDCSNLTVKINITKPNSTTTTYNMTDAGSNIWYYEYTPTSSNPAGRYNLTIIATDASNNTNNTETDFFDVYDITAPSANITAPAPNTTYDYGSSVKIIADVTDETALDEVLANITWGANSDILQLAYNSSSSLYENSFTSTTYLGRYNITITANDTSNNINSTETTYFNIADLTAPAYSGITTDPISPALSNNTLFTFYATWTDNVNISKVQLEFNGNNYTVSTRSGDQYYYTLTNLSTGTYQYRWYANDTSNNRNSTDYFNYTVSAETTAPTITSYSVSPPAVITGENATLNLTATDNVNISSTWAVITLPDSSTGTVQIYPQNSSDYTTTLNGRYNVTFYANDTAGNQASETDYFIAGTGFNLTLNVKDHASTGVDTNVTIYLTGTNKKVRTHNLTGTLKYAYAGTNYDLLFTAYNKAITVRLNNVNLSKYNNKTLGIDKKASPISGYLVTYGITSEFNQSNVTLTFDYTGQGFTNENYMGLYRCADWNFTAQTCAGAWSKLTAATQDKTANTFTVTLTTLSGFSIKQETVPSAPGGEDTGGGGAGAGIPCSPIWNCTEWSECSENRTQTRFCTNIGTCFYNDKTETQNCTYTPVGEVIPVENITPIEEEVPKPYVKKLFKPVETVKSAIKTAEGWLLPKLTSISDWAMRHIIWILATIVLISGSVAVVITVRKHEEEISEAGKTVAESVVVIPKQIEKQVEKRVDELDEKLYDFGMGVKRFIRKEKRKAVKSIAEAKEDMQKAAHNMNINSGRLLRKTEKRLDKKIAEPVAEKAQAVRKEVRKDIENIAHVLHLFKLRLRRLPQNIQKDVEEDVEKVRQTLHTLRIKGRRLARKEQREAQKTISASQDMLEKAIKQDAKTIAKTLTTIRQKTKALPDLTRQKIEEEHENIILNLYQMLGKLENKEQALAEKVEKEKQDIRELETSALEEQALEKQAKEFIVSLELLKKKEETDVARQEKEIMQLEKDLKELRERKRMTENIQKHAAELEAKEKRLENKENMLSNMIKKDKELSKNIETKISITKELIDDYKEHIKKLEQAKQDKKLAIAILKERVDLLQTSSQKLSEQKSNMVKIEQSLEKDKNNMQEKEQELKAALARILRQKEEKISEFKKAGVAVPQAINKRIEPAVRNVEDNLKNIRLNIKLVENRLRKIRNKSKVLILNRQSKLGSAEQEKNELNISQEELADLNNKIASSTFAVVENAKLLKKLKKARSDLKKDMSKKKKDMKKLKQKESKIKNKLAEKDKDAGFKEKIRKVLLVKKQKDMKKLKRSVKDIGKLEDRKIKEIKQKIRKSEEYGKDAEKVKQDLKKDRRLLRKIQKEKPEDKQRKKPGIRGKKHEKTDKKAEEFVKDMARKLENLDQKAKKQAKKTKDYKKHMLNKLKEVYK